MKKIKFKFLLTMVITITFVSCGGGKPQGNLADNASGDMVAYASSSVNAIEQARPTIIVIPGDGTLQNFGCLTQQKKNGESYVIRDYQTYLLKDDRCKRLVGHIQDLFTQQNYPLNDFEQSLKKISTKSATDVADNYAQDAKTRLMQTVNPDIILELDYQTTADKKQNKLTGHNYSSPKSEDPKNVSYTLRAIDAYNNKVVASITKSNMKGTSTTETIQDDIDKNATKLMRDIQQYFSDILTRGRDVTVRITLDRDCPFGLLDESIEGDSYADWIIDYIKTHTVKGAYKMVINTNNELSFENVRIPLLQEDGTQYGVYDWTRDLQKNLKKNLGIKSTNRAQGLGEIVLTINKL